MQRAPAVGDPFEGLQPATCDRSDRGRLNMVIRLAEDPAREKKTMQHVEVWFHIEDCLRWLPARA